MTTSAEFTECTDQNTNITTLLLDRFEEIRRQFPERFQKPVHILQEVDDWVDGQWEQRLHKAKKIHTGEYIAIIPCNLGNSYWIGVLIEFRTQQHIERAEVIGSVEIFHFYPDKLQKLFDRIYPGTILRFKQLKKRDDTKLSAELTVQCLLMAAESSQISTSVDSNLNQPCYQAENTRTKDEFSTEESFNLAKHDENMLTPSAPYFTQGNSSTLYILEKRLVGGLEKWKIQDVTLLSEQIRQVEKQIETYERHGRTEEAEKEKETMMELRELQIVKDKVDSMKSFAWRPEKNAIFTSTSSRESLEVLSSGIFDESGKKRLHLQELREDLANIPLCTEKIILHLLVHFEERLLEDNISSKLQDDVVPWVYQLQQQVQKQALFSEEIIISLQSLEKAIQTNDSLLIVSVLKKLLKKISFLNISEIKRLVSRAQNTAELIHEKDIILLVGESGSGKSTTIQFLAGSSMQETRIQIAPGKFLEHIEAFGPLKSLELRSVISSPLSTCETRYITPVTVQLQNIFGPHETEAIILCDAPAIGDTVDPEVDIANGVGIIELLKGCNSVKLLVLQSSRDLGSRGHGIQKLAHMLINMIDKIEDKLDSIFYAFTKYDKKTDIYPLLLDIKKSQVDKDPSLTDDHALAKVLSDMILKTQHGAYKIDPLHDDPRKLIEKLRDLSGIKFPGGVFRYSVSQETQATIENQVNRDKFNIVCAVKNKDSDLIMYHLNNLKTLTCMIKLSFIYNAYEDSVRHVSVSVDEYSAEIIKKFNRDLDSQYGLKEEDIHDYETALEYLQQIQKLKEHLGSDLRSYPSLMENISFELEKRVFTLIDVDLYSHSVQIYLDNLRKLKSRISELESNYNQSCSKFEKRFEILIESVRESIFANEFKRVAEIMLTISKSSYVLNSHLGMQLEEKYKHTIKLLLDHLTSLSEKANLILSKLNLNENDIESLKKYTEIIRSAKEISTLQEYIATYKNISTKDTILAENNLKDLKQIYNEIIENLVTYIDNIGVKIEQYLETCGDYAFDHVNKLLANMKMLRTIGDLEQQTAEIHYRTVENICGYVKKLQRDAEQLLVSINNQTNVINSGRLGRSLLRLKNAKYINDVSSVTYDSLIRNIRQKLVGYARTLENHLKNIDLTLRFPVAIRVALQILEKMESISALEYSIPELEQYKTNTTLIFFNATRTVFDQIQKTFNLQDIAVYKLKQKLKQLEHIKREYESLHPARVYLQRNGYSDINALEYEIEDLRNRHEKVLEAVRTERCYSESKLQKLNLVIDNYKKLTSSDLNQTALQLVMSTQSTSSEKQNIEPTNYLVLEGYRDIDSVHDDHKQTRTDHHNKLRLAHEQQKALEDELARRNAMKEEHDSLLSSHDSISPEQIHFLQENQQENIKRLNETIQEKMKIIAERENTRKPYIFSNKFDDSTANNALLYITQCEAANDIRVKQNSDETNRFLTNYTSEYGNFLKQEIDEKLELLLDTTHEEDRIHYRQDLEMRLNELSSLKEYQRVFQCINGKEEIDRLHRKLLDHHRRLSVLLEQYKVAGRIKELRDQLAIVKALSCVDRFCANVFADNDFQTLHKQYSEEINKFCREIYNKILGYIFERKYADVDMALSDKNYTLLHSKNAAQIKHQLRDSLRRLMADITSTANSLDEIIEKEDYRNQLIIIKETIDRIRVALGSQAIMNLLDNNIQDDLNKFNENISETLAKSILKAFQSIEKFVNAYSFSEAEQGMEKLNYVRDELAGYCMSDIIDRQIKELRTQIDDILSDFLTRYDSSDIKNWSLDSLKDLFVKLKMVADRDEVKYKQAYMSMIAIVKEKLNKAIEGARDASYDQISVDIHLLTHILCFLSEELEIYCKEQIDELRRLLTTAEEAGRRELQLALQNMDGDESSIVKIDALGNKFNDQKMYALLKGLKDNVLRQVGVHLDNMSDALDKQEMQDAIFIAKKIFNYREYVKCCAVELEKLYQQACACMIRGFMNCAVSLANVSDAEQTLDVEKSFDNLIIFLHFCNTSETTRNSFLPKDVLESAEKKLNQMSKYFNENSDKFRQAIKEMDTNEQYETFTVAKRWDQLLRKIQGCLFEHVLVTLIRKSMSNVILYTDMIFTFNEEINHLKEKLDTELINNYTKRFDAERKEFFNNLMKLINKLKKIYSKLTDVVPTLLDFEKLDEQIKTKIEELGDKLLALASKSNLSLRESDEFRALYELILSFHTHLFLSNFDVQHFLKESEEEIYEKVISLRVKILYSNFNADNIAQLVIAMKFYALNFSMFDKRINSEIDEALEWLKENANAKVKFFIQLVAVLKNTDIWDILRSEHAFFAGDHWEKRREKMRNQDNIEYVLDHLEGDNIDKEALRKHYEKFREIYDKLINNNLKSIYKKNEKESIVKELIAETKHLVREVVQNPRSLDWNHSLKSVIHAVLAHIFAVWTLQKTQYYIPSRGIDQVRSYLPIPHAAQVITTFRILGIGYTESMTVYLNNLVEIGTGEGKSVVMAVTACFFSLLGISVYCACYSEVLSNRDKNDFASIFKEFDVEERIEYGTFNKLCERLLNERCNVREKVRDIVLNNKSVLDRDDKSINISRAVLLIDEVDVFLSEKFYGGVYRPYVYLKDPVIKTLLDTIWKARDLRTLNDIKGLPIYKTCSAKFSGWIFLFNEAIKDMLAALQSYQSLIYIVQNDKIAYVDGELIAENVVHGYYTIWAYYHENQQGNISTSSLETNVGLIVNCGAFSHAEMPHEFAYIAGVTGTLKTLAQSEKDILKNVYGVKRYTFMPSVFGKSNRIYNPCNDVITVDESAYFGKIREEIDMICNAKRAILVFFESEQKLKDFYNSDALSSIKDKVQIITEKVSVKDRDLYVKRASIVGQVTLLTRIFGRGTDFICRSQQLLTNGGIHVLQTFFSEELSEEYQIMGRGARQGDNGSYRMILLDKDLEWVLGSNWNEKLLELLGSKPYDALNQERKALYDSKCETKQLDVAQCKLDHEKSKKILSDFSKGNINDIKAFLLEQNRGPNLDICRSRTVLLMDGTNSMSNLLAAAKETVCTMFERATVILKQKRLPSNTFQMQFAIYRNYNSKEDKILQVSPWETKPNALRAFMDTVRAEGGFKEEAIEIGLCHAFIESQMEGSISQVILIGDAPANTPEQVRTRRERLGESYWSKTNYAHQTDYKTELEKLRNKNIPVHAFYLQNSAKENFEEIAKATGGRCQYLDINLMQGAKTLIDLVTEEVLRRTGGAQGDAVVESYRRKYISGFTS